MLDKLWPQEAHLDDRGDLWLGGCSATKLAAEYGTPLYVFDEATLRGRARAYLAALKQHYPGPAQVAYAAKAYLCRALAQLWNEEGLDLDVVSGGELHVALAAGFPPERIHFHGNNKTAGELQEALAAGVGRIVVDNFHELALLADLVDPARDPRVAAEPLRIWLRVAPGIQAHTHAHIQTGHLDTKFGFTLTTGDAERAAVRAMRTPGLALVGLHCHIGSQIYETEELVAAAVRLVDFAADLRDRYGFLLHELSPGGGWGVPMTPADPAAPIADYVAALAGALTAACRQRDLPLPRLILEPGRSLVAPAAVALYTVGSRKEIPGIRTYVAVDGGMADNIRPALYGAQYTALRIGRRETSSVKHEVSDVERRAASGQGGVAGEGCQTSDVEGEGEWERVTIAGKFCESGDVLIRDIALPRLEAGDLLAIPMAGAYTLAMASNYNLARRPAVVLVNQGEARLIQRRESYADLLARDLPLHDEVAGPPRPHARPAASAGRRFAKYQALGNDYIVLDPADWPEPPAAEQIRRLCDRRLGVGADGILWGPLPPTTADAAGRCFGVRLFNPDGSEFEKSGNGLRIFARYLWDRRLPAGPDFALQTPAGPVVAHVLDAGGDRIALDMGRLSFDGREIPLVGSPREVIEEPATVAGRALRITAVGIGNPHCVVFVDDPDADLADLARSLGPEMEHLPLYPNRTNVQFARVRGPHELEMAIWERGAGYTLASGTSSCAAAGAAIRTGRCVSPVTVHMPGGSLRVEVNAAWEARLIGAVAPVCTGEVAADLIAP